MPNDLATSNPPPSTAQRLALFLPMAAVVLLAIGIGLQAAPHHEAPPSAAMNAAPATSTRPTANTISSDALPHVQGKKITTMVVEFPPSGFSPPHHHGGSVTVYVLSGTIRSQLEGQPAMVYKKGESFFEPPGAVHLLAENVSATKPARILAVFVADEDASLTTYH